MTRSTSELVEPAVTPAASELPKTNRHASRGFFQVALSRFFKRKLNVVSLVIFGFIVFISAIAPILTSNFIKTTPDYFRASISPAYAPPGTTETLRDGTNVVHWLGTDELGRDTLVRLLHAGGASLSIGFLVTIIIVLVGVPIGLISGFFGGWVDDFFNAVIQIINNIPGLYLFIILAGIFRPDIIFLSLIFGLLSWTPTARQVRGLTLTMRSRDFVTASIAVGAGYPRILAQHLLPNIVSILVVLIGADVALAMLGEAALSFLGFGIRDPDVSWGKLLANSSNYLTYSGNHNPFLIIGPGLMIFVTILSVYLIADGLRDAFDPALRG
ncbi:MAG TPA: ABC transporter permease [Chloroflexia bacterium]|nr:ABC transporter permease [Chloroflexia bacterium]